MTNSDDNASFTNISSLSLSICSPNSLFREENEALTNEIMRIKAIGNEELLSRITECENDRNRLLGEQMERERDEMFVNDALSSLFVTDEED